MIIKCHEVILEDGFDSSNDFIASIKPCEPNNIPLAKAESTYNNYSKLPEIEQVKQTLNAETSEIKAYPTIEIEDYVIVESIGIKNYKVIKMNIIHYLKYFIVLLFFCLACKKEKDTICPSNITNSINPLDFHYQSVYCTEDNFERYYKSEEAYFNDTSCNRTQVVPFPLTFKGIILLQGVKVPYIAQSGSAYEKEVLITTDSCSKNVFFHFKLITIDTFGTTNNLRESVLVLLEDIDSTYTVNFSHEVIPYSE